MFGLKKLFGYGLPDKNWLTEASSKHPYTPDLHTLEEREYSLLFVYGADQRGLPQYKKIEEHSVYVGSAFTKRPYTLWKKKLGEKSFPFALEQAFQTTPSAKIKGQLHAIFNAHIPELDKDLENGVQFVRQRVHILLPYREVREVQYENGPAIETADTFKTHIIKAFMYVGVSDYWNPLLDGGYYFAPVKRFQPKNDGWVQHPYYCYTKMEYDE